MSSAAATDLALIRMLHAGGENARAFDAVYAALWRQAALPPQTLELARLRLAQLHRAERELAHRQPEARDAGLTEEKIQILLGGEWYRDIRFSKTDRAVLDFTEVYAQDPGALTDELANAVKQQLGEPGLVGLVEALGFLDGRIRLSIMMPDFVSAHA
jgi:alkylhydroperoxidase family enzyme